MGKTMRYYEAIGDKLQGIEAVRAYRAAQNQVDYTRPGYMQHVRRLQAKLSRRSPAYRQAAAR